MAGKKTKITNKEYPIGLKLQTTRGLYLIIGITRIKSGIYGYRIRNLKNGKEYDVSYGRIHSKTYWPEGPREVAEVLYGQSS